jgi:hypothetical protein
MASAGFEPANSGSSGQYANHQTTEALFHSTYIHQIKEYNTNQTLS